MNALLTGPERVGNQRALAQYFQSVARHGFDIACISCPVLPWNEVTRKLSTVYTRFVSEAKTRGYPACILIRTSLLVAGDMDITEAQFDIDNRPVRWGDEGYLASCASSSWLDYVKGLISFFVRDLNYNWLLIESPVCAVDIPGTEDRFYKEFLRRHPDMDYPQIQSESAAYLTVQELKEELFYSFCHGLIEHGRQEGLERVGTVVFTPNGHRRDDITPHPRCANGGLAPAPGLDFVVVSVTPTTLHSANLEIGDVGMAALAPYSEVLAHSAERLVLAMAQPPGNPGPPVSDGLHETECKDECMTASLAAAPSGIVTHWDGRGARRGESQPGAVTAASCLLPRFGRCTAPVAFVFSSAGAMHAHPHTYETVWESYWAVARQMLLVEKHPMLTFSASALEEHLEINPQVRLLVLEEHFPLTAAQVQTILSWWTAESKRALVIVGGDRGFSADVNNPGVRPLSDAFPGLLERLGLRQEAAVSHRGYAGELGVTLKQVTKSSLLMQLKGLRIEGSSAADVRRIFGSKVRVLYSDEGGRPIIAKWSEKSTVGYLCGLESSDETARVITCTIRDAMCSVGLLPLPVTCCSEEVLWSSTSNGYLVLANCSASPGSAAIDVGPHVLWDVLEKRLVKEGCVSVEIPPRSVRAFRSVAKRVKLYDIDGARHVASIAAGAGRADITMEITPDTAFIVNTAPRRALVDGVPVQVIEEDCGEYIRVALTQGISGRRIVTLRW